MHTHADAFRTRRSFDELHAEQGIGGAVVAMCADERWILDVAATLLRHHLKGATEVPDHLEQAIRALLVDARYSAWVGHCLIEVDRNPVCTGLVRAVAADLQHPLAAMCAAGELSGHGWNVERVRQGHLILLELVKPDPGAYLAAVQHLAAGWSGSDRDFFQVAALIAARESDSAVPSP